MPSIVLFDLGNVLLDWDPARLYEKELGSREKAEEFCRTVTTMEWHTEHDRGVPMAENALKLIEKHPEHAELIHAWRIDWLDMFHGYVDGTPQVIEDLQAEDVPLYALTNFPADIWEETVEAFPVMKVFRDTIISSHEGVIKPDPVIYDIALKRMGSPDPAEIFFIDDRQANVDAARTAGMRSERFVSADQLRRDLEALDLL